MIIPISEFAPDQPDVPSTTSDTIYNVLPITPQSYGAMPSFQAYSSAITARPQGSISAIDATGSVRVFVGDAKKLYRITSASVTPADVSIAAGYTTADNDIWSFTQFGTRVIATNFTDPPQSYVEGTSTLFANMISSGVTSLKAKIVSTVKEFIVFGNTTDAVNGNCPQRVHWSAVNDPTNFPTPGTQAAANALSDFQDNLGIHGILKGIAGNLGSADAGIFYERAVYRMIYSGQPDIFNFIPAEGATGLLASGGLTQSGPIAYYCGENGFNAFDGSQSRPIGKHKIDRFFYTDADSTYLNRMTSAVDPQRGLLIWSYAGIGNVSGQPNRLLIYSPYLDRWTATETGEQNISCLVRGATFNKTLEALDSFGTVDSLPFSMDSPAWSGGKSLLSGFDSTKKFGYFNGANLSPNVVTSDIELIQGRTSQVSKLRPLADNTGVITSIASRYRVQDNIVYGDNSVLEPNGSSSVRSSGRYHRFKQTISHILSTS